MQNFQTEYPFLKNFEPSRIGLVFAREHMDPVIESGQGVKLDCDQWKNVPNFVEISPKMEP
jgi:hypothetical protein